MPVAPYYVTTDATGRWSGDGLPLTAAKADENIWKLHNRIDNIALIEPVSITGFTATGSNFYVEMTDNTTQGPFTLPSSKWLPRGDWAPSTTYALNDVINSNGGSYLVLYAHVSELTFDPAQTDGLGHSYYGKIFEQPGNSLPTGGSTGYFLSKKSSASFDVEWVENPLPAAGSTGQYLVKSSSTDFAVEWADSPLPTGGDTGYLLAKSDSADFAVEWVAPAYELPTGGATGDILAKNSSTDRDVGWSADFSKAASTVTGTTGIGTADLGDIKDRAKYRITPTGTLAITAGGATIGNFELIFTTTGTTAYTVTLGSGLKSTGTLSTGTVAGKVFVIAFVGDGAGYYEVSRTTAM